MNFSMGTTIALIGLYVTKFSLNSLINLNAASIFLSSVKDKNILDSAAPFLLGNQLVVINTGDAVL